MRGEWPGALAEELPGRLSSSSAGLRAWPALDVNAVMASGSGAYPPWRAGGCCVWQQPLALGAPAAGARELGSPLDDQAPVWAGGYDFFGFP
jgi:hypothetical protein